MTRIRFISRTFPGPAEAGPHVRRDFLSRPEGLRHDSQRCSLLNVAQPFRAAHEPAGIKAIRYLWSAAAEEREQTRRQPGHVRNDEDANSENRHHRPRRRTTSAHRPLA